MGTRGKGLMEEDVGAVLTAAAGFFETEPAKNPVAKRDSNDEAMLKSNTGGGADECKMIGITGGDWAVVILLNSEPSGSSRTKSKSTGLWRGKG
jgi:hypothetical protein